MQLQYIYIVFAMDICSFWNLHQCNHMSIHILVPVGSQKANQQKAGSKFESIELNLFSHSRLECRQLASPAGIKSVRDFAEGFQ